jgi:uncharacterized protein
MKVQGSVALVTGASSGIGAATAKELARSGAQVLLLARSRDALERVAAEITASGGRARSYPVDLTNAAAVERVAQSIRSEVGPPHIIVNNAGAGRWLSTEETSPEEAAAAMASPYFAAFNITRAFFPEMLKRNTGHIVNVNSPASYFAWPGATGYGVARWAMRGFAEMLRADLHGTGLKVSLVTAAKVRTPYFENNPGTEERIPRVSKMYPTLEPEEVAAAIVDAIEREKREVILPFLMSQTVFWHKLFPRMVEWLIFKTGHKRPTPPGVTPTQGAAPVEALRRRGES